MMILYVGSGTEGVLITELLMSDRDGLVCKS